jgi:hypothetical protein
LNSFCQLLPAFADRVVGRRRDADLVAVARLLDRRASVHRISYAYPVVLSVRAELGRQGRANVDADGKLERLGRRERLLERDLERRPHRRRADGLLRDSLLVAVRQMDERLRAVALILDSDPGMVTLDHERKLLPDRGEHAERVHDVVVALRVRGGHVRRKAIDVAKDRRPSRACCCACRASLVNQEADSERTAITAGRRVR